MVRKGILIGTEALVYFELVTQDWVYQPSHYAESNFCMPMEYRQVYCKNDEEPSSLMVMIPRDSHNVRTTEFTDGPRPSAIWYNNSPLETENTVPIYNRNKKLITNPHGELFSSSVLASNSTSVTNSDGELVGAVVHSELENTQASSQQCYYPRDAPAPLPHVSPPGSECVGRKRPNTGPNKPFAVLRRLDHSYLQDHECSKLEDDTVHLRQSSQWQLIKVLVLQDLVNMMLPLLLEEERTDHPSADGHLSCSGNFPSNSQRHQATEEDDQAKEHTVNSSCTRERLQNTEDCLISQLSVSESAVNTKTALIHIFNIQEEVFLNIYYNILEIRSYQHAMLVSIHEVRTLPKTSLQVTELNESLHEEDAADGKWYPLPVDMTFPDDECSNILL